MARAVKHCRAGAQLVGLERREVAPASPRARRALRGPRNRTPPTGGYWRQLDRSTKPPASAPRPKAGDWRILGYRSPAVVVYLPDNGQEET